MRPAEAGADDATLDAIAVARGRVPVEEFRLRADCATCTELSQQPVGTASMTSIYDHIADSHKDEVL